MQPKPENITLQEAIQILQKLSVDNYTTEETKTTIRLRIIWPENRVLLLDNIEKELIQLGFALTRPQSSSQSKKVGHIRCGGILFVVKPAGGATENLKLKSTHLAKSGRIEFLLLNGKKDVECFTFQKAEDLASSILQEFKDNPRVGLPIIKTFQKYFDGSSIDTFKWNPDVLPSEKNELGKYLGELLIGYQSLKQKTVKKFVVPNSSRFPGIDCAIIDKDNKTIGISNKFGTGGKSSFFTSILQKVLIKKIPKGARTLKRLATLATKIDSPREIVYEWGIRSFLGFTKNEVPDTHQIFKDLATKKISKTTKMVLDRAKQFCFVEKFGQYLTAKEGYSSLTNYFGFELANQLSKNAEGMEFMHKALNFLQASLNISKWVKGEIFYTVNQSSKMKLQIQAGKSSTSDLHTKQGLITFSLHYDSK